jgi:hypothetical protein
MLFGLANFLGVAFQADLHPLPAFSLVAGFLVLGTGSRSKGWAAGERRHPFLVADGTELGMVNAGCSPSENLAVA